MKRTVAENSVSEPYPVSPSPPLWPSGRAQSGGRRAPGGVALVQYGHQRHLGPESRRVA